MENNERKTLIESLIIKLKYDNCATLPFAATVEEINYIYQKIKTPLNKPIQPIAGSVG